MKKICKSVKIRQNFGHEFVAPFWPTLYVSVGHNMSCAKTDEPIDMQFGVWTRVAQRTMCLLRARIRDPQGK